MSMPSSPGAFRPLVAIAAALAALMVLTRFGHFGELSRLPDASWAVFFLGGLLIRDARAFVAFFGLAWLVDLGAMAMGTPADCFSLAYLLLVPAYAALWFAGRAASGSIAAVGSAGADVSLRAAATLAVALVGAVAAAYVVSNLGFWAFGTGFAPLSAADYAARVAPFFPGYLAVTSIYASGALASGYVAARLVREARRSA